MSKTARLLSRSHAAELGQQTIQIIDSGFYQNATGKTVFVAELIQYAVENTCSYPPNRTLPKIKPGNQQTHFQVINETTLTAAQRLIEAGHDAVALNFASAKRPGGGFVNGARAQEESLVRSSGLYACLIDNPMYEFHQSRPDPMYSDYAIYSPDVPVFRLDDGTLLEQPYLCSFITAPAVNAKAVLEKNPQARFKIRDAMKTRIMKILTIAAIHGHDTLVLGAWGCGVFGNDGEEIAQLFKQAFTETFSGVFSSVVFAVLDWSEDQHLIASFEKAFAGKVNKEEYP